MGQEAMAYAIRDRVVQYLSTFGTRKAEPIHLSMMGLCGVGKSTLMEVFEKIGIPFARLDAQNYLKDSGGLYFLSRDLKEAVATADSKPFVLFIDEIDKTPEILPDGEEETQPAIGALNQILSDGKVRMSGAPLVLSNIFVVTAMNFSPKQIETFSKEILKQEKSYWEYTEEDMGLLDTWLRKGANSRASIAKMLSLLFRSNTISRFVPDAVVAKPLYGEDFDKIVKMTVDSTISRLTQEGTGPKKRLNVTYTDAFLKHVRRHAVFAPGGARVSVKQPDLLVEQLVTIGTHLMPEGHRQSLDVPRRILLDATSDDEAHLEVVPILSVKGRPQELEPIEVRLKFDSIVGSYSLPEGIIAELPEKLAEQGDDFSEEQARKPPTVKEVLTRRKSLNQKEHGRLKKEVAEVIFDQEEAIEKIATSFGNYKNRDTTPSTPSLDVIMGFPGTGKTDIVMETAEKLGIKVVKINLQFYSSDTQDAANRLGEDLYNLLEGNKDKKGKVILLIEEMDKLHEIDPTSGHLVNRPAISLIKDLLSDGTKDIPIKKLDNTIYQTLDIHGFHVAMTMNFAVDRFHLSADPRLTSIDDMQHLYEDLTQTPEALRQVLASMFLPETINRFFSSVVVARPVSEKAFSKIILKAKDLATSELLEDEKGRNVARIDVRLTPAYLKYLFSESVIPAEGGRQALIHAMDLIQTGIREGVSEINAQPNLRTLPVTLQLDYHPRSRSQSEDKVITSVQFKEQGRRKSKVLKRKPVALRFPSLEEYGEIPQNRYRLSVHEFGHAMVDVLTGNRFEHIIVVQPTPHIAGVVKQTPIEPESAAPLIANLCVLLGSRAMERIMSGEDELSDLSVLEASPGTSADVSMATTLLWKIIYQLGLSPSGGTIERSGLIEKEGVLDTNYRRSFFEALPHSVVEQLGLVLRDLETEVIRLLLQTHSKEWYHQKILKLARKGEMTETEFYRMIGYEIPEDDETFLGEKPKDFGKGVTPFQKAPPLVSGKPAWQNLGDLMSFLEKSIRNRLASVSDSAPCKKSLD